MKKVLAILAIITCTFAAQAQTKIGHVNRTELFQMMPQVDTIKQELANETSMWQAMYGSKETELKEKYEKLQKEMDILTEEQLQVRTKELEDLQNSLQELQQRASQALQNSENEKLAPVFQMMDEAISAVAKEKGYDYVVDSSEGGGIIYSSESHDLLPLVKAKLNIN